MLRNTNEPLFVIRNTEYPYLFWNDTTGYGCLCSADLFTESECSGMIPTVDGELIRLHEVCDYLEEDYEVSVASLWRRAMAAEAERDALIAKLREIEKQSHLHTLDCASGRCPFKVAEKAGGKR